MSKKTYTIVRADIVKEEDLASWNEEQIKQALELGYIQEAK